MSLNPLRVSYLAVAFGVWLLFQSKLSVGHATEFDALVSPDAATVTENASRPSSIALLIEPEAAITTADSGFMVTLPEGVTAALSVARRFRSVHINPKAVATDAIVKGDTLFLRLFDDVHLWATIEHTSTDSAGVLAIRGRIQDTEYGTVLLSIKEGRILARIEITERQQEYLISDFGAGVGHVVQEIDVDLKDILDPGPVLIPPADNLLNNLESAAPPLAATTAEPNVTIDVMIVYTPAARKWAETNATSIHHVINQAIARGQWTLENTRIGMTLNLVAAIEVAYTESGDSGTDLERLTFHAGYDPWWYEGVPRYMEDVHRWRDEMGADLVTLFARVDDVGGLGWLLNTERGWPELGFQLVRVQQAHFTYTHIHEIGHNLGAHHHKEQIYSPGPGLYSYSAGWRWTGSDGGRYCSVMTYESGRYYRDGLDHLAVPYFSNPALTYLGAPTGNATDGNNARTLVNTRAAVAAYRPHRLADFTVTAIGLTPTSPLAGGVLTASVTVKNQGTAAASGGELSVWVDRADAASCGSTGTQKQTVGTLAAGASKTLTFESLPAGPAGTKTFRAFVDSACAQAETNEANNQMTRSYTVIASPTAFKPSAIGVWRPGTGRFYLDRDGSFTWTSGVDRVTASFGVSTDRPVVGDWNGDGTDDIGVWRPSTGRFYLDIDGSRTWTAGVDLITDAFGIPTDHPVAGDWNGDGIDDIGVWRPSTRRFYLDIDGSRTWTAGVDLITASFGIPTDRPVAGDWDGDGVDDIGVWRPSTGRFYLDIDGSRTWSAGIDLITDAFGIPGDHPVAGDWNGDGFDDIGVWRPSTGRFYLDVDGSCTWSLGVDLISAPYGMSTDLPVAGRW